MSAIERFPVLQAGDDDIAPLDDFPTLDELNGEKGPEKELDGIVEVNSPEYARRVPDDEYLKRGIRGLIEIDVRRIAPRRQPEG